MTAEEDSALAFVKGTIANLKKHMDISDSKLNFITHKVWEQQCHALARWELILKMMLKSLG